MRFRYSQAKGTTGLLHPEMFTEFEVGLIPFIVLQELTFAFLELVSLHFCLKFQVNWHLPGTSMLKNV